MALTSHEPKFTTKTIAYLARIEPSFSVKNHQIPINTPYAQYHPPNPRNHQYNQWTK